MVHTKVKENQFNMVSVHLGNEVIGSLQKKKIHFENKHLTFLCPFLLLLLIMAIFIPIRWNARLQLRMVWLHGNNT